SLRRSQLGRVPAAPERNAGAACGTLRNFGCCHGRSALIFAMPNFLESIFSQLQRSADRVVLREVHGEKVISVTGRELLESVHGGGFFLRMRGMQPGDRCALYGANSISWIACNLALMAEKAIVVPLYSRQAPADIVGMLKDCAPRLLLVGEESLGA